MVHPPRRDLAGGSGDSADDRVRPTRRHERPPVHQASLRQLSQPAHLSQDRVAAQSHLLVPLQPATWRVPLLGLQRDHPRRRRRVRDRGPRSQALPQASRSAPACGLLGPPGARGIGRWLVLQRWIQAVGRSHAGHLRPSARAVHAARAARRREAQPPAHLRRRRPTFFSSALVSRARFSASRIRESRLQPGWLPARAATTSSSAFSTPGSSASIRPPRSTEPPALASHSPPSRYSL